MKEKLLLVSTLAVLMVASICSCGKDQERTDFDQQVDYIWDYSQKNPSGFTINVVTFEIPKEGIVVSYQATQNSFGKEGLRKAVRHSLSHCNIVGGWLNPMDSIYYFDSDTIFQESMLDEALIWAKENKQMSVFVLSEQKEIPVELE